MNAALNRPIQTNANPSQTSASNPAMPLAADKLVAQAFEDARSRGNTVTKLQLSYVREDGVLDPAYGTAEAQLGAPKRKTPADDPNRPIGAPVPSDPQMSEDLAATCPTYTWERGARTETTGSCLAFGVIERPRCSVLELWKQALEAGAPGKALAVIALYPATQSQPQTWTFTIEDGPRDIHFQKTIPDTCDPTLEKPLPAPAGKKPNPY